MPRWPTTHPAPQTKGHIHACSVFSKPPRGAGQGARDRLSLPGGRSRCRSARRAGGRAPQRDGADPSPRFHTAPNGGRRLHETRAKTGPRSPARPAPGAGAGASSREGDRRQAEAAAGSSPPAPGSERGVASPPAGPVETQVLRGGKDQSEPRGCCPQPAARGRAADTAPGPRDARRGHPRAGAPASYRHHVGAAPPRAREGTGSDGKRSRRPRVSARLGPERRRLTASCSAPPAPLRVNASASPLAEPGAGGGAERAPRPHVTEGRGWGSAARGGVALTQGYRRESGDVVRLGVVTSRLPARARGRRGAWSGVGPGRWMGWSLPRPAAL